MTSSEPGNEYDDAIGTAEASAQVAASPLVRQYDPAFAATRQTRTRWSPTFSWAAAHPIVDATKADRSAIRRAARRHEPHGRGGGHDLAGPSVVGAGLLASQAELGDGTDGWTFQVQLTNVSDAAHAYTLAARPVEDVNPPSTQGT